MNERDAKNLIAAYEAVEAALYRAMRDRYGRDIQGINVEATRRAFQITHLLGPLPGVSGPSRPVHDRDAHGASC